MSKLKYSNKGVAVKNLKQHIYRELSIHPELKTDSDISNKGIEDKIEKKCGKNIEQKVTRSCIPTIVEELIDEIDKD